MVDKKEMASYIDEVVNECEELYNSSEGYRKNEHLRTVIFVGEEKSDEEE